MKLINKYRINDRTYETYSPWQNIAEKLTGKVKEKCSQRMVNRQVPTRLWDYGLVFEYQNISITRGKGGRTPLEKVTGDTPDISE